MQRNNETEWVEKRKRGRLIHRFQRKTDPSIWLPGTIVVVISAAILWAASELNTVHKLNLDIKDIVAWRSEVDEWQDEYELRVNSLELMIKQPLMRLPPNNKHKMGSSYMVYSNGKGNEK